MGVPRKGDHGVSSRTHGSEYLFCANYQERKIRTGHRAQGTDAAEVPEEYVTVRTFLRVAVKCCQAPRVEWLLHSSEAERFQRGGGTQQG